MLRIPGPIRIHKDLIRILDTVSVSCIGYGYSIRILYRISSRARARDHPLDIPIPGHSYRPTGLRATDQRREKPETCGTAPWGSGDLLLPQGFKEN
jgi:hypothetical protein